MTFGMESVVRQSARTASRVVEDQAVVIVIDQQKLHTLNEVGTFVWSSMGVDGRPVGELVDALLEEFDVERDRAAEDVLTFLAELDALGAVERAEGGGS